MGRSKARRRIVALGVLTFGLGLAPSGAKAQLFGGGAPMPPSGGAAMLAANAAGTQQNAGTMGMLGMAGNPYANPMLNPLTNPYMTQTGISSGNAALYFIAAQQMGGGIGSGKLGGPNASRGQTPASAAAASKANENGTRPTGANTPGATASRYFGRTTPKSAGTSQYYARQSRYFPNNGR